MLGVLLEEKAGKSLSLAYMIQFAIMSLSHYFFPLHFKRLYLNICLKIKYTEKNPDCQNFNTRPFQKRSHRRRGLLTPPGLGWRDQSTGQIGGKLEPHQHHRSLPVLFAFSLTT